MRTRTASVTIALVLVAAVLGANTTPPDKPEMTVPEVLDDFHAAAAASDFERYFGHFAPDAVFLGTDATERWTLAAFKAFAKPYFDEGRGWAYTPRDRHVAYDADRSTAWFDETVVSAKYGVCRGTGVLVQQGGAWKVARYNLTFPIPNEIALDVIAMIRRHDEGVGEGAR